MYPKKLKFGWLTISVLIPLAGFTGCATVTPEVSTEAPPPTAAPSAPTRLKETTRTGTSTLTTPETPKKEIEPATSAPSIPPPAEAVTTAPAPNTSTHTTQEAPTTALETKNDSPVELRMMELEAKISGLNDKLELAKTTIADLKRTVQGQMIPTRHPADISTTSTTQTKAINDPELGFVHDEAIEIFRKSMIQFQSQKYPESVLSFTEFLDQYRDHPLAGSAQYYIAKAYLLQKEFKLAIQEYKIVLSQYEQSPHVSDAIKDLMRATEATGDAIQAQTLKARLTSEYPQSPAAGDDFLKKNEKNNEEHPS